MFFRDQMIQTKRIESSFVSNRKNCLQRLQGPKRDQLALAVGRGQRNRSAAEEETAPNHCTGRKWRAGG